MFQIKFLSAIFRARKRHRRSFLTESPQGETIDYNECLGASSEVFPGKTKQRVYEDQRNPIGNYKTVLGKEDALRKVIEKT